jgi:hypothetical protein
MARRVGPMLAMSWKRARPPGERRRVARHSAEGATAALSSGGHCSAAVPAEQPCYELFKEDDSESLPVPHCSTHCRRHGSESTSTTAKAPTGTGTRPRPYIAIRLVGIHGNPHQSE